MLQREDSFLVPGTARIVSEAEQKSFNNKVIRMLGVFRDASWVHARSRLGLTKEGA
jgi:hypothetical protein